MHDSQVVSDRVQMSAASLSPVCFVPLTALLMTLQPLPVFWSQLTLSPPQGLDPLFSFSLQYFPPILAWLASSHLGHSPRSLLRGAFLGRVSTHRYPLPQPQSPSSLWWHSVAVKNQIWSQTPASWIRVLFLV